MAIVVRRAEPKDLPVMLDIYNDEVLHGSATFDVTPKTLEERQVWFGAHTWPARPLLVATDGNCVLGYASLSDYKPKEAYAGTAEISVYVARDARGRRIGRQLVEALIEQRILVKYPLLSRKIHTILDKIHSAGNKFVAVEVLGQIQCQI